MTFEIVPWFFACGKRRITLVTFAPILENSREGVKRRRLLLRCLSLQNPLFQGHALCGNFNIYLGLLLEMVAVRVSHAMLVFIQFGHVVPLCDHKVNALTSRTAPSRRENQATVVGAAISLSE